MQNRKTNEVKLSQTAPASSELTQSGRKKSQAILSFRSLMEIAFSALTLVLVAAMVPLFYKTY